jgi:hypothetical protein
MNLQVHNPTSRTWTYLLDIISGGVVIDSITSTLDADVTKLLGTDIKMPEVTAPTEVTFQVHVYEVSGSQEYDLGIVATGSVWVTNMPSGDVYNAEAYFDNGPQASYQFEAGTIHKVTVKFTNPYDKTHEFYIADDAGLNVFNTWGFFSVGAGKTVVKEVDLIMSTTPQVLGPVTFSIHCTTKGLTGPDVPAGSVEIIESTEVQAGTIEMIPVQTSVGQGRPFEFDIRITNTTNRVWSYRINPQIYDSTGKYIAGLVTNMGVAPMSSNTERYTVSLITNVYEYPATGAAALKTNFMGAVQSHGTINITAANEPGVTATLRSTTFTYDPAWGNYVVRAELKNNAATEQYYQVYVLFYYPEDGSLREVLLLPDYVIPGGGIQAQEWPITLSDSYRVKVKVIHYAEGWIVDGLKTTDLGIKNLLQT